MAYAEIPLDFRATSFDVINECLIASVQGVEAQVSEFSRLHSGEHIQVFNHECGSLVKTLSRTFHDRLSHYNETLSTVQMARVDDQPQVFMSVAFCIVALTELERVFKTVVDLLTMCSNKDWWITALELSNPPPSPIIPRWSGFSLAIRSCEWSMDIVDFGFHALQQFLAGASSVTGAVFKWSDKQSRMVLHIDGKPLYHDEGGSSLLDVTKDSEGKDVAALIQKLVDLNETRKRTLMKRFSKADANMHIIADVLSQKLHGPRPEPNSLPYTFRLDPSKLKMKRVIAGGGYGCVTKSTWLGRTVSEKKVIVPGLSRKQFEMEAAILATVQHPRVVRMIGCAFEEKEKTGSLVMELMEGDLPHAIEKRCPSRAPGVSPFPLTVAIDIMLQIGEGMQYLREHKILHRDLKGKNVLLNRCRTSECGLYRKYPDLASLLHTEEYYIVKLADFGIAKVRRGQTDFRTMMAGTTFWRAPEVFRIPDVETTQNYEWPADVYSFAMTCYEILTGCIPFDEVVASELHERIVAGDRPPLDDVKIPPLLKDLVERCWKTDPNERPNFNEICKTLWQCKVENILPAFRHQIGLSQTENVAVKADVECSRALPCLDPANSCSQYGFWWRGHVYCGEAGACTGDGGGGTPPSPAAGGLGDILTRNLYEDFFPDHLAFYSYGALIEAARMFPQFGTTGDINTRKREIAAYAAHVSHETSGLRYITELGTEDTYCDASWPEFPCGNKQYKGRGPLQLLWNYNYGAAGNYLHEPLLENPDLVATNPVISFKSSLWFWHRFQGGNGIPHIHDVITGEWQPNSADQAAHRVPGFGVTILIINGGLECNRESAQANSRVNKFIEFCGLLNVSPGANTDCKRIKPF